MSKKMYADESKVAIYKNSDDAVENPENNIENVFFHTDFYYMSIKEVVSTSISLPRYQGFSLSYPPRWYTRTYTLYEHNYGQTPYCIGYVKNHDLVVSGTFLIDTRNGSGYDKGMRHGHLQVTDNEIKLIVVTYQSVEYLDDPSQEILMPSMTLDIDLYIFDEVFDA